MSDEMKETQKRWRVIVAYFSATGDVDVEHFIEELEDLHDLVERGPNWYAIKHIAVFLNVDESQRITLEHEDAGVGMPS